MNGCVMMFVADARMDGRDVVFPWGCVLNVLLLSSLMTSVHMSALISGGLVWISPHSHSSQKAHIIAYKSIKVVGSMP